MTAVQLVPVALSLLLLAAHFLRADVTPLVVGSLALLGLLVVRRPWSARVLQVVLVLGAAEWARTLVVLAGARAAAGRPMLRMVAILGAVAALTGLSALVFRSERLRSWFRIEAG